MRLTMIMGEVTAKPINSFSIQETLIKNSSLNSNIEFLLNEIKIVNSSINEVGISIYKIAKSLYEIKKLIKNNYWVKFTESGNNVELVKLSVPAIVSIASSPCHRS